MGLGLFYYYFIGTPTYSLYQTRKAIKTHDSISFNQYVDVDRIVDGLADDVFKDSEEEMGSLPKIMRGLGKELLDSTLYLAKESLKENINKSIEDISQEGENPIVKTKVKEVKKEGKSAEVVLTNSNNEEIKLTMVRMSGRRWKIVRISFDDFKKLNLKTDKDDATQETDSETQETEKKTETQFVVKDMGEEVFTKIFKLKVNSAIEKEMIASSYGTPQPATDGAKFIIVNMDITNLTNDEFMFPPNDNIRLIDDSGKKFKTYDDTGGNIDDYLNFQDLSPSIVEKGVLVYEIPQDTGAYYLFVENKGTDDVYQIKLK